MKNACRTLFAGVMAAAVVCAPATGTDRTHPADEQDPQHRLGVGWKWALEPVDIRDRSLRPHGSARKYWDTPEGIVRLLEGDGEDEVIVEFTRPTQTPDWDNPESTFIVSTQVRLFLENGEPAHRYARGGMRYSGEAVIIGESVYQIPGGIEAIEKLGVAYLTHSGRLLANRHRRERTERMMEEAGVSVLPAPIHGESFGDFEIETLDHGVIRSEDLRGSVVLIHAWRSDLRNLERMVPALREFARAHTLEGLVIIGVNHDADVDAARAAIAEHDIFWPQIHALSVTGPEHRRLWSDVSEHNGFPYHTLIRRSGLVYSHGGGVPPFFLIENCLHEGGMLQRGFRNRLEQCPPPAAR